MYEVKESTPASAFVKGFRDLTLESSPLDRWIFSGCESGVAAAPLLLWEHLGSDITKKKTLHKTQIQKERIRASIAFDSTRDAVHNHVGCKHN